MNVLITGGAKRIGKGLALKFAELGWDIFFSYNTSEEEALESKVEIEKYGVKCFVFRCDVTNVDDVDLLYNSAYNKVDFIDVIINNIGVFPEQKSFSELDKNQWTSTLDVILNSSFNMVKGYEERQDNGRIINIGSVGGLEIWDRRIDYNVAKSSLIRFSKALARDLAPNFSCNVVNPGLISFEESAKEDAKLLDVNKIPMKRFGNVSDIFDAVYYFSTSSNYITGQMLNVDGGLHL